MARKPLTTPEQVFTLKELLAGRSPEFVAQALARPTVDITAWAHDHGHPDTGRMRQHLKRAENIASRTGEDGPAEVFGRRVVDEPARRSPVPRPDLSRAHTAPATTPPPAVMPVGPAGSSTGATPARGELVIPPQAEPTALVIPTLDALYARATTPRAQRAAQRVRDAITALQTFVDADAANAARKAEIARLEQQLAAARAAAKTSTSRTTYHPTLPPGPAAAPWKEPPVNTGTLTTADDVAAECCDIHQRPHLDRGGCSVNENDLDGPGIAPCPAHREGLQLLDFTRALDIATACDACVTWKAAA